MATFDWWLYKKALILKQSPDLGACVRGGGVKAITRFRSVSDAEWHSELLHSSQPVQSKQAASAPSTLSWFPQTSRHWVEDERRFTSKKHKKKKHLQLHVQYVLLPNPSATYPKEFPPIHFFKWVRKLWDFSLAPISTEYCVAAATILSALLCTPVTNPFRSIMLRPCNGNGAAIDCGSVPAFGLAMLNAFVFLVRGLFSPATRQGQKSTKCWHLFTKKSFSGLIGCANRHNHINHP